MARNPVISPYRSNPEYKGQDVVHWGFRIPLKGYTPLDLLVRFSRSAQKHIKLPAQEVEGLRYRWMFTADLPELRSMWFNPNDPAFPQEIDDYNTFGMVALFNDKVVGGIVLSRQGSNLFMQNLIAGDEGKKLCVPTKLVYQAVVRFINQFHSIDVGVSYNPKRYAFFKHFDVERYPVILKAPELKPVIRLTPFRSLEHAHLEADPNNPSSFSDSEHARTFVPNASLGLYALLRHLGLKVNDLVLIVKTFPENEYVPGCLTDQIERICDWRTSAAIHYSDMERVKAVLVIHEFGIPASVAESVATYRKRGIPIIEDCAYRTKSVIESDFRLYSFTKLYALNFGGAIAGIEIPNDKLWEYGCLDFVKQAQAGSLRGDIGELKRKQNWFRYHELVVEDGMTPFNPVDFTGLIEDGWAPTVYMQQFESDEQCEKIVERLEEFGIQAGVYWGSAAVFLPVHQGMTIEEVEYMFAVIKGYFNTCRDYGKA